jgi:hypothetical protein
MEQFNPNKAIDTLRKNYLDIQRLGELIEQKRNQFAIAEAELLDAEQQARKDYFGSDIKPCKTAEFPQWMKLRTWEQIATESLLRNEIRTLQGRLDILIEINNNIKASIRLAELDYKNQKFE